MSNASPLEVLTLQFFIYIAWLSFGRAAVNPFGEDDADINVKELAEKHRFVSTKFMNPQEYI